jgi:hypothetical protein
LQGLRIDADIQDLEGNYNGEEAGDMITNAVHQGLKINANEQLLN